MSLEKRAALLARMASRAVDRSEYLGWVLARYADSEQKTDEMMASLLRMPAHDLYRIRLCLRPRSQSFADDVGQIARKFGADATFLAQVIRHVEALEGMKDSSKVEKTNDAGLLMAARARPKKTNAPIQRKNDGSRSK
jgi:hypothetical protein